MTSNYRVSIREVAKVAGVSPMTVSRALRNSSLVAAPTRQRVQRVAHELGYFVNPLVAAQMSSVRSRKVSTYEATIGLIVDSAKVRMWKGAREIANGVIEECEALGFKANLFDLANKELSANRLESILRARGIRGMVVAPMLMDFSKYALDFKRYIIVDSRPHRPPQIFHHVYSDHFGNIDLLLRKIRDGGFTRPGLMVTRELDAQLNHLWTSRYLSFQIMERWERLPPLMAENRSRFQPASFLAWKDKWRPDVLIVCHQELYTDGFFDSAGVRVPDDLELVKVNINDASLGFSGIDLHSVEVGRNCVRLLARLMYQNEYGLPTNPLSILVPGVWTAGGTCPSLR